MANTQASPAPAAAPAAAAKHQFHMPSVGPGTLLYFLLRREGSGGLLAIILPLAGWFVRATTATETFIAMWLGACVIAWFQYAQANAARFGGSEEEANDDKQQSRDAGWSRLPVYAIGFILMLSMIAWGLKTFTNVFVDSLPMWLANMLILKWGFLLWLIPMYAVIKTDLDINSQIVSTLRRFIGSRTRLNEVSH